MLGRVWSGIPIATILSAGTKCANFALDPSRSLRIYLSSGLNWTLDSAEMWEKPATGVMHGTKTLVAVLPNTLVAVSTPCIGVTIQARAANAGPVSIGGPAVVAPYGGGIVLAAGASYTPPGNIDDLIKVYVNGTINDIVDFFYTMR